FSNSAARFRTACCTAPTLSTPTSAAAAMPASDTSTAAIAALRPKTRIVSAPEICLWSATLRLLAAILHHGRPNARARLAPDRHRADVRGGRVLCPARHHGQISESSYEHAGSRVGALHRRIPVSVHRVESVDPPRPAPHHASG